MNAIDPRDRPFVEAVAQLLYVNPFLRQRVELEQQALGDDFVEVAEVWHFDAESGPNPNILEIDRRSSQLLPEIRGRLQFAAAGETNESAREQLLYRDLALYSLYYRYQTHFLKIIVDPAVKRRRRAPFFVDFERDYHQLFDLLPESLESAPSESAPPEPAQPKLGAERSELAPPELLFAWFFQIRRAFHNIFRSIVGGSMPTAELRAAIWQSIFSHDMRRFRSGLYRRMGETTTLITGPSGTGKELVARAIGLSRFIPFNRAQEQFAEDASEAFFALNLSALSPTLIESELFGHKRGAFTGALADHRGWFEVCPPLGAVFLDEIGEIDESIQVKLLRVLETRVFQRLGESEDRHFRGKLIAATNRDPDREMRAGRMREDFYYRLCSDRIETPSLQTQLEDAPEELPRLVFAVCSRIVDPPEEEPLAAEVLAWIEGQLGSGYRWPGNFRELEQCARNILIRGEYRPAAAPDGDSSRDSSTDDALTEALFAPMRAGELDAELAIARYATWVYSHTNSYVGAADRLGLDRRTVKAKIDRELLERFKLSPSSRPEPTPTGKGTSPERSETESE